MQSKPSIQEDCHSTLNNTYSWCNAHCRKTLVLHTEWCMIPQISNAEGYIAEQRKQGDVMLQQQECKHLKELVEDWKRTEIQNEASDLKTYKYSSEDIANMLSNLLFERSKSLEDASVRDIVQLIRELNSQGALDGSGNAFSKHFISVLPHMSVLCPVCQRESDIAVGMTCYCSRCGAEFRWSEEEGRYYPQPQKL